jgi:hypothetical protein
MDQYFELQKFLQIPVFLILTPAVIIHFVPLQR